MARSAKPVVKAAEPEQTTAVTSWEEDLAREAQVAAAMEANSGGAQFFSTKGGILRFNDTPVPDNEVAVVIVDSIMENVFYHGRYDADNPAPPTCFAFGRDDTTMAPHITVKEAGQAVNDICKTCPNNEWASSETGRGKACRNTRRLALIPAGDLKKGEFFPYDDPATIEKAPLGFLKLPVTSVKGYATYIKATTGVLALPPWAFYTKIKVVPDPKTQLRVTFEVLDRAPREMLSALKQRSAEAKTLIEQPYPLRLEQAAPAPKATRKKY